VIDNDNNIIGFYKPS